jgi:hypothetical protein
LTGLALLLFLLIPAVLALVGLQFAEDRSEELLYLKLFGHAILGAFTFRLNGFPLPVGILIALLLASNAAVNKKARRVTAGISFALFLIGLLI